MNRNYDEDFDQEKQEYLLKWALKEQLKQDAAMQKYPSGKDAEPGHVFSKEHEKRMERIFRKAERAEKRTQRRQTYLRIAASIAVLFCVSSITIMEVDAFRMPVMRFFTEVRNKATGFLVEDKDVTLTERFVNQEPRYVPKGFDVLKVNEEADRYFIKYINEEQQQSYVFYYFVNSEDCITDTENGHVQEIQINDNKGYIVQKEDEIQVLLDVDGSRYYLMGNIPLENAIKIMESIKN